MNELAPDEIVFCQDCLSIFPPDKMKVVHPSADGEEAFFYCPYCTNDTLKVIKSNQYDLWSEITVLRKNQRVIHNLLLKAVEKLNEHDNTAFERQHFRSKMNFIFDGIAEDFDESE